MSDVEWGHGQFDGVPLHKEPATDDEWTPEGPFLSYLEDGKRYDVLAFKGAEVLVRERGEYWEQGDVEIVTLSARYVDVFKRPGRKYRYPLGVLSDR